MGYKAGYEFAGQAELSFNAHVFATREEANTAGHELNLPMNRKFKAKDIIVRHRPNTHRLFIDILSN